MIELIFTLIGLSMLLCFFILFYWIIDIHVTKGDSTRYGWASYITFKKEYSKHEWEITKGIVGDFLTSKTGDNRISQITYSARFRGADMIINNPIGFVLTKLFIRKQFKKYIKKKWKRLNSHKIKR